MSESVCHLILALAVLGAYVGLTIAGQDGNPVLGVLAGQGAGAGIHGIAKATRKP